MRPHQLDHRIRVFRAARRRAWASSGLRRCAISDAVRQRHPVFRIVAEISSAGRYRHSAYRHLARRRSLRYADRAHRHLQPADTRDDHLARDPCVQARANEIEEAAFVDGYGPYANFFLIALLAWKSLMGAIVFSFVLVWNEFLIALTLTTSDAKTLPVVVPR